MIVSFADEKTEQVFRRQYSRELPEDIQKRIRDKLLMLENTGGERDLCHLASNERKRPGDDWTGQWSLRINERWCLYFGWQNGNAHSVRIVARPR